MFIFINLKQTIQDQRPDSDTLMHHRHPSVIKCSCWLATTSAYLMVNRNILLKPETKGHTHLMHITDSSGNN